MDTAEQAARKATWSVWEIVEDMESRLEEAGGEVTPDIEALEELSKEEAEYAITQWIAAFKDFKFKREGANAAKQHYAAQCDRFKTLQDKCKERIDELLGYLDTRKVSGPTGTAYRTKGRARLEVDDEALPRLVALMLAEEKIVPDKDEIARQLKKGNELPGCRFVDGEEGLTVK